MNGNRSKDPCLDCDCYDPDMGCTMPSVDKGYACLREGYRPIEFFLPIIPPTTTHQTKQVRVVKGKPKFYEPPELADARAKLTAHLAQHAPADPMTGPVWLTTKWCFPAGNHSDGEYKTTRPDADNMIKLLKDVMTRLGFWQDDAQVAREVTEKFWATIPGIYIRAEALT